MRFHWLFQYINRNSKRNLVNQHWDRETFTYTRVMNNTKLKWSQKNKKKEAKGTWRQGGSWGWYSVLFFWSSDNSLGAPKSAISLSLSLSVSLSLNPNLALSDSDHTIRKGGGEEVIDSFPCCAVCFSMGSVKTILSRDSMGLKRPQ